MYFRLDVQFSLAVSTFSFCWLPKYQHSLPPISKFFHYQLFSRHDWKVICLFKYNWDADNAKLFCLFWHLSLLFYHCLLRGISWLWCGSTKTSTNPGIIMACLLALLFAGKIKINFNPTTTTWYLSSSPFLAKVYSCLTYHQTVFLYY